MHEKGASFRQMHGLKQPIFAGLSIEAAEDWAFGTQPLHDT
jgi:hypothetical protein